MIDEWKHLEDENGWISIGNLRGPYDCGYPKCRYPLNICENCVLNLLLPQNKEETDKIINKYRSESPSTFIVLTDDGVQKFIEEGYYAGGKWVNFCGYEIFHITHWKPVFWPNNKKLNDGIEKLNKFELLDI